MERWNRGRKVHIPNMEPPKTYECKVCGSKIVPNNAKRYVVEERIVSGGLTNALSGEYKIPRLYDAFDCSVCGCQFVAKERLRNAE